MTQDNAPEQSSPVGAESAQPDPIKTPGKRRRWPVVVLGVAGVVLLLVLLTPTLLSTGPARSFVVGKINDNLNGRIEIADWKISWTGGIVVRGIRVFDERNSQIAQVESLSTQLSLVKAIGGDLNLGETVLVRPDFTLVQDPDGVMNFARLAKLSDKAEAPPSDLPNVTGNIRIENGRGTFVRNTGDPSTSQKVKMTDIAAAVRITDINQPIDHSLSLAASVNDGPVGALSLKGTADVIDARRVAVATASLDETIDLRDLDAASIAAFLPPGLVRQLEGRLNGVVVAKAAGGKTVDVRGDLRGRAVVFATPAFSPGEAYRTDELSIVLPLAVSLPNGLTAFEAATVRTDGPVSVKSANAQLNVDIDAPLSSLLAATRNQAVTLPGTLHQSLSVDLPPLAVMLPQTLGLKPGSTLTGGRLMQSVTGDLSPGQSKVTAAVDVKDVQGSTTVVGADGTSVRQAFAIEPVTVQFSAVSRGGGMTAPDLRDLQLTLGSGFAGGSISAETLASLKGKVDVDLAKLKEQFGQFLSLDATPLAGTVTVVADSTGDPTRPADPATFTVTITGNKLHTMVAGKTFRQDTVRAMIGGTAVRTDTGEVREIRDVRLTTVVGAEASPTLDVEVTVPTLTFVPSTGPGASARYDIPSFTLSRAALSLKQAQADFGAFVPVLKEFDISSGTASVTGTGAMVGGSIRFDGAVVTDSVSLGRYLALSATGPASAIRQRTDLLKDYTLTATIGATYQPRVDGAATLTVRKLDLSDNQKLLTVLSPADWVVALPKDGPPQAAGSVVVTVDLARLQSLSRAALATTREVIAEATSPDKPLLITKGVLSATVELRQQPDGGMVASLKGGVDALTVAGNRPVLTDEKVTLSVKATTASQLASATLEQFELRSGLAAVDASGQWVLLTGAGDTAERVPPLQGLRKLSAKVTTDDLGKLQAIADALRPAERKPVALGPVKPVNAGHLVELADATGKLPGGTPIPATLPAEAPSLIEQIGEVKLTQMSASAVGMTIGLTEPIVARSPARLLELLMPAASKSAVADAGPAAGTKPPEATTAATQPAPVPAARLARGTATLTLEATGDGRTLTVAPDLQATGVTMSVGAASRDLGQVSFKSTLSLVTGVAEAAGDPALTGGLTVNGPVEPLLQLSEFLGGRPATSPYAGTVDLTQKLATEGAVIKLQGVGGVTDFVTRDTAGKTTFAEKSIRFEDDVSFDTAGVGSLSLTKLGILFESSGALNLGITGRVTDPGRTRSFDRLVADVTYDAEKLWPIVRTFLTDPAMPPEQDPYKDYVVRGKTSRQFQVNGSLPALDAAGATVPMAVALRSLIARGSVGLDLVQAEGLTIERLEIPVTLSGGVLRLLDDTRPEGQQRPAPMACNGGAIDIGGVTIDLNGTSPVLSTPANLALLNKVQLTPALAKSLGDLVNNPLFVPSAETKGIMDVTMTECRDVPLGKKLKVSSRENKGYAVATFSFSGAQFKNSTLTDILGFLKVDADSLQGSVRDGKVTYSRGYIGHDMTFVVGERQERTIHLYGRVNLADSTLQPLTMLFSADWFGGEIARFAPKGVPLAMTGPFSAPRYNFNAAIQETIKQNYLGGKPEDLANLIDLFGGKKKPPTPQPQPQPGAGTATQPSTAPPAAKPQDNPLGIFGDILGQAARDREKKEQEKKERERREKEKRDARKRQQTDDQ